MTLATLIDEPLLCTTLCSILEQAAFVFAEPVEDSASPPAWNCEELLRAALPIEVEGLSGTLWLVAERPACVALAANLLGIEPDDAEAEQKAKDALGELLNIVCGALLERSCGEHREYSLGTPVVDACDGAKPVELPGEQWSFTRLLTEDGQLMELHLRSTSQR